MPYEKNPILPCQYAQTCTYRMRNGDRESGCTTSVEMDCPAAHLFDNFYPMVHVERVED